MSTSWVPSFLYSQFLHTPPIPTTPLTSQVYIITGSNTGLGFTAAAQIASLNTSKVILAVRSLSKGHAAVSKLVQSTGKPESVFEVWPLDLSSAESIKAFGKRVAGLQRLDAVVQNAGILMSEFQRVEGFGAEMEAHVAVNVIGALMLGFEVLPKLRESARAYGTKGRLCFVGSDLFYAARFKEYEAVEGPGMSMMSALKDEGRAVMNDRYATSKLLLHLSIRSLAQLSPLTPSSPVLITTMSPGACATDIFRDDAGFLKRVVMQILMAITARSAEVGGRTLVNASSPDLGDEAHGGFIWDFVRPTTMFVASEKGREMQERWWGEVCALLEGIQPGITKV